MGLMVIVEVEVGKEGNREEAEGCGGEGGGERQRLKTATRPFSDWLLLPRPNSTAETHGPPTDSTQKRMAKAQGDTITIVKQYVIISKLQCQLNSFFSRIFMSCRAKLDNVGRTWRPGNANDNSISELFCFSGSIYA